jgi:hypothetical protein
VRLQDRICIFAEPVRQYLRQQPPAADHPPTTASATDQQAWYQYVATQCILANVGAANVLPPIVRRLTPAVELPLATAHDSTSIPPRQHIYTTIGPDMRSQVGSPEPPSSQVRGIADDEFDFVMAEWLDRNASRQCANIRPTVPPPYRPVGRAYRTTCMPHPPSQPSFGMRLSSQLITSDLLPRIDQRPYRMTTIMMTLGRGRASARMLLLSNAHQQQQQQRQPTSGQPPIGRGGVRFF